PGPVNGRSAGFGCSDQVHHRCRIREHRPNSAHWRGNEPAPRIVRSARRGKKPAADVFTHSRSASLPQTAMAPPYVFVGHAPDDRRRLRPLIEALALHGLSVFIDRPGGGPNPFEFEPSFIARYGIRSLRIGEGWSDRISDAIRGAG